MSRFELAASPLARHLRALLAAERGGPLAPSAFTGSESSANLRLILLAWLAAVAEELALRRETWHTAARLVDGFMRGAAPLPRLATWQCVGTAALLVAAKSCEAAPPGLLELVAPSLGDAHSATALRAAAAAVKAAEIELIRGPHFTALAPTVSEWIAALVELLAGAGVAIAAHFKASGGGRGGGGGGGGGRLL